MKLFSHKQKPRELKTESEEELSVEDILAEYQAEEQLQSRYTPEPDGRGEYYSSSQGGAEDYYDSEGLIFRHVKHVTAETAEDIPWTLDGEYDPGAPLVEIGIEDNGVTMLL